MLLNLRYSRKTAKSLNAPMFLFVNVCVCVNVWMSERIYVCRRNGANTDAGRMTAWCHAQHAEPLWTQSQVNDLCGSALGARHTQILFHTNKHTHTHTSTNSKRQQQVKIKKIAKIACRIFHFWCKWAGRSSHGGRREGVRRSFGRSVQNYFTENNEMGNDFHGIGRAL